MVLSCEWTSLSGYGVGLEPQECGCVVEEEEEEEEVINALAHNNYTCTCVLSLACSHVSDKLSFPANLSSSSIS